MVFRQHVNCSVDLISCFHVDFFGSRHCLQIEFISSLSFPIPGISVPWTHCKLISSSIQAFCWKYTSTLLSYFSFSSVATRPFPLKIRAGFTFCSPSAPIQSFRVACRLSKPEDGCDTHTSLAPNVSQVLSCSFTNGTGTYLVDIVCIFRYPSSILWVNCIGLVASPLCFQGFPQIPVEFLDRIPAIICLDFFLVGPSPQYYGVSFLESLEPLAAFFKFCSFFCAIECFDFRFHFFLTKVWTLCFLLADSAGKGLEARGYLSVRRDLFPAILLLCLFFVMVRVSSARVRVSSARILLLFFSHLGTSDLLTPCCFATVFYLLVDDFSESKRSSVFFMKSTV